MANPTIALIEALRLTATNLSNGAYHSWGHHGACNCGNLVQSVTKFTKEEILRHAHTGTGEWTELAIDFCPITNTPLTLIFNKLEEIGLTPTDIHHIEYLSDREVLNNLPGGFRWLKRNKKEDAIVYFETFATVLEEKLLQGIHIDMGSILQNKNGSVYAVEQIIS
jgi:hypothetical protein